ncbi:sugar fermentation stimulation protein A [Hathewaya proteolytica DSM 3090]|uniref:Sugar fermentation stimulation protein homolog n=1 Tax=Hathewaya proteolytica DSM 3090 TaxID=1121331 RepID=A0A1M6TBV6_9CLOT|nr:DNA/RNA nuclease SfsA [Hathewaya proteolytica]SHK54248.1 sugar fermentation stimulation protein A [Hathewaya proteolytica DSM 3090]
MVFNEEIIKARFIKRPNRFQGYVCLNGEEIMTHVPNTGRCKEILIEGCQVILRRGTNENRKTKYDLIAAYKGKKLINIDSQIPNKVVEEALKNKKIKGLERFNKIEREKTYGNSRFDFRLTDENNFVYYLEVKGVTLEEDGVASFPDAPTERGRKHVLELIEVKKQGMGAGVIFLLQMDKMKFFSPNEKMDPAFASAIKEAYDVGVEVFAYDCSVGESYIEIGSPVPISI